MHPELARRIPELVELVEDVHVIPNTRIKGSSLRARALSALVTRTASLTQFFRSA